LLFPVVSTGNEDHPHPVIFPILDPPFDGVVDLSVDGIRDVIPRAEKFGYRDSIVTGDTPILLTNKIIREHQLTYPDNDRFVAGLAELRLSESVYGVSFFIDPRLYIELALQVSDDIDTVVFFYNSNRSDPPVFREEPYSRPLDVSSVSASSSADAFEVFADKNAEATSRTAFVFIRGFIELNTNALLDFVLKESWNSKAVTIGNNASYVKAGMSLALIPDFRYYGQQISNLLIKAESESFASPRVHYLQTETNAINVRTARRSNIEVNDRLLRHFNYSYPVR